MSSPSPSPSPPPASLPPPLPEHESSFFPSPPSYYKLYSSSSLSLPPPDVSSIIRHGSYSVFGETWPVEEVLPTLEEMGVRELFARGDDRAASLLTLLKSLLITYTSLITSLTTPPPSLSQPPPQQEEEATDHIRLICINMHFLINELRPIQARETLRSLVRNQIEKRREKTLAIRLKLATLSATLAELKSDLQIAAVIPDNLVKGEGKREGGEKSEREMWDEGYKRLMERCDEI